jgi:protein-S-isoprenylcysteine O-methyltransferase Ste14
MYVAVVSAIAAQAAIFGSWPLLAYAAVVLATCATFVAVHEQPYLRQTFGADYTEYCAHVRPWIPRLTPWRQPSR